MRAVQNKRRRRRRDDLRYDDRKIPNAHSRRERRARQQRATERPIGRKERPPRKTRNQRHEIDRAGPGKLD